MQFAKFLYFLFNISIVLIQIVASNEQSNSDDRLVPNHVEFCLAVTGLNINIFGITQISELTVESYNNLQYLDEDTRNCFMACVFQRKGMITEDGKLSNNLPNVGPHGKRYKTTYDDAVNACRVEKNFCKLGGCLYEVYY